MIEKQEKNKPDAIEDRRQKNPAEPSESQRQAWITEASRRNTEGGLEGLRKAAKTVTAYN